MLFVINYTIWNLLRYSIIREEGRMFHLSFLLRLHICIVVISTSLFLLLCVVLWSVANSFPLWRHNFCLIPGHCELYPGSARQNCVIQRYLSKEESKLFQKCDIIWQISTERLIGIGRRPWQSDIQHFGQS